ncbi:MAG: DUF192 domain-containing protein [Candidatus Thiodiazotropha sp. (ex. Lucinoma kazani)]
MKQIKLRRQEMDDPTTSEVFGLDVLLANSYLSRLRGLLGKKQLSDSEGLLLKRCETVHTVGMRYPLDLVFMDKRGKVLKCQEGVKPFRTAGVRGAYYTLELNQGMIRKQSITVDDRFVWHAVERE